MPKRHKILAIAFLFLFTAVLAAAVFGESRQKETIKTNASPAIGCSLQELMENESNAEDGTAFSDENCDSPAEPLHPASFSIEENEAGKEANAVGELIDMDPESTGELTYDGQQDNPPHLTDEEKSSGTKGTLGGSIIGSDDRVTIWNTSKYPYCAIANIYVHFRCGCEAQGTGFMVGPSGLVTASHCLVCTSHGKSADRLTFYFGYNTDGSCYYYYDGPTSYWYGTDFKQKDGTYKYTTADWDYGYVKLKERVGDYTGWFGISVKGDKDLNGWYEVAGYRDGLLKTDSAKVKVYNDKQIIHYADMLGGNSGCPIFNSDYYAIAINVADSSTENYGRRFTSDIVKYMREAGIFD